MSQQINTNRNQHNNCYKLKDNEYWISFIKHLNFNNMHTTKTVACFCIKVTEKNKVKG